MRRSIAILLSFLLLIGIFALAALYLVPLVVGQLTALVDAVPRIAASAEGYLSDALGLLLNKGLLLANPRRSHPG